MKLVRAILSATALASLSAPVMGQNRAEPVSPGQIERVFVGETPAPGQIGAGRASTGLYEGRSVASGKRHCWINVYGDRQCEYR